MAVFPISPSANDTTTIGGTTYIYTGVAWRVVTGNVAITTFAATPHSNPDLGDFWYNTTSNILYMRVEDGASTDLWLDISTAGGAGLWSGTPEDASLDGVVAVKKQSAAPSATADYAKIYSKSVIFADDADILLHANNSMADSGSIGATVTTPGTSNSISFRTVNKFGSHSMFFNPSSGGDSFAIIPYSADHKLKYDGDFTIDCWVRFNADSESEEWNVILHPDSVVPGSTSSYADGVRLAYYGLNTSHTNKGLLYWSMANAANNNRAYGLYPIGMSSAAWTDYWHHIAVVRDSSGGRFYLNGERLTVNAGGAVETDSGTVNSSEENYVLGRLPTAYDTASAGTKFHGYIDEFRMLKDEAVYTSNFTPPERPHTRAATITKIFAMDSLGNETQLTP